jgi:hypothetical protein
MRKLLAALIVSSVLVTPAYSIEPVTTALALNAINTLSSLINISKWLNGNKSVGYVVVTRGEGRNPIEAQNMAYMRAVDEAVGAYIGSHTEVRNGEVVRNDLVKHVTGYVNKYEILEQGDRYVIMRVWVQDAGIARGLLPVHTDNGVIDGNQTSVQISTYEASHKGAQDTINSVLAGMNDGSALSLKTSPAVTKKDSSGNWATVIPVEVKWNHDYLISVIRVAERVQTSNRPGFGDVLLNALEQVGTTCNQGVSANDCRGVAEKRDLKSLTVITRTKDQWVGRQNVITLDRDRWETFAQGLYQAQSLRARVEITNSRGTVFNQCIDISNGQFNDLVSADNTRLVLNENGVHRTQLWLPVLKDDRFTVKIRMTCS